MKYLLTICLTLILFTGKAQVFKSQLPKEDYSEYKPCTECFDIWKTSSQNSNGQKNTSTSQQNTKQKIINSGKSKLKAVLGVASVIVVGALLVAVASKTTSLTTNALQ